MSDGCPRSDGIRPGRSTHWELARALLDVVPPDSLRTAEKRRWFVASAAFMQSRGHQAALMPHMAQANLLYPEDAHPSDPRVHYLAALFEGRMAPPRGARQGAASYGPRTPRVPRGELTQP